MKIGEPSIIAVSVETTTLHLTPQEIALFKLFREHQKEFQILAASKVFDIKAGQAVLSFDGQGTLTKVSVTSDPYDTRRGGLTGSTHTID